MKFYPNLPLTNGRIQDTSEPSHAARMKDRDYTDLFYGSPVPCLILAKTGQDIVLSDYNRAVPRILPGVSPQCLNSPIDLIFENFPGLAGMLAGAFAKHETSFQTIHCPKSVDHPNLKFILTRLDDARRALYIDDIHEQRVAEADLKKSKERLELALYAAEAGMWDWHIPTGEVIFGEQWAAILGYTVDEISPHLSTWENRLHPEDKALVINKLERHLKGELHRYESEHRLRGKDGRWVWVLDVGKVVEWDTLGNPLRMTGTKVDISKRKKMEAELALLNAELEKRIEQRTRKLKKSEQSLLQSQAHLRQKSIHLEEANNALKILLKKSAENKKEIEENILANIKELVLPYLDKIQEPEMSETQRVYLGIVRANLDEITSHFSRKLTTLHLHLTPAEMSVAKLVKQGKSTKEIADLLFLSKKTIETQRRNIRRKLGLCGKKFNLKTYLDNLLE